MEKQPGRAEGGGKGAITWEQTLIMAADALLHFHSCGVAHLWAAITDQMIQTGPCEEETGLTERLAALFFSCVQGVVLYDFKQRKTVFYLYIYTHSHTHIHCECVCMLRTNESISRFKERGVLYRHRLLLVKEMIVH